MLRPKPILLVKWTTSNKDVRLIRNKLPGKDLFSVQHKPIDSSEDLWQDCTEVSEAALAVSFLVADCKDWKEIKEQLNDLKKDVKYYQSQRRSAEAKLDEVRNLLNEY